MAALIAPLALAAGLALTASAGASLPRVASLDFCADQFVLALADRVLVMHEGRITGEMPTAEADRQKIGLLMCGVEEGAA